MALSVASFAVAGYAFGYAQILINRWNNFLIATGGGDPRYEKILRDGIAIWRTTGFALIFSGMSLGVLALFFYKKSTRQQKRTASNV